MAAITRHALRVYASLTVLKGNGEDVLDALIPFFDPILQLMDGKVFDPRLLAVGVKKLYHWKFTKEVAEQFIPRLEKRGYLKKVGIGKDALYSVTFPTQKIEQIGEIQAIFEKLVDEFAKFPPIVTDLLNYQKSRDDLSDILIRFLVSSNSLIVITNGTTEDKNSDVNKNLATIEEGGRPLSEDDKYMAARFVKHVAENLPEQFVHLAHIASIGLLTEVVDDFVRPITSESQSDLCIVLDAPIALAYLGLSGLEAQRDTKGVLDELKKIGCKLVVFPVTCREMTRNLQALLSKDPTQRHGPTHQAIITKEVLLEFVQKVKQSPESALENAGVQVKPIELDQYPNTHKYFDEKTYEDFYAAIGWVTDTEPREHDATCLAIVMRLREGKHSNDVFKSRFVLATRNPKFAKESRKYCLQNRSINENQEGPVVHQRELATVAWLRTGLGSEEGIPRASLVASCDRLLRVRPEVADAIRDRIASFRPELLGQFELLMLDHKSLSKLSDSTLNDANIVTDENAMRLLELMRQASISDAKQEFEEKLNIEKVKNTSAKQKTDATHKKEIESRNAEMTQLQEHLRLANEKSDGEIKKSNSVVEQMMKDINTANSQIKTLMTVIFIIFLILGAIDLAAPEALFSKLPTEINGTVKFFSKTLALVSFYYLLADMLQTPKWGLRNFMTYLSARKLKKEIKSRGITWVHGNDFKIEGGSISKNTADISGTA